MDFQTRKVSDRHSTFRASSFDWKGRVLAFVRKIRLPSSSGWKPLVFKLIAGGFVLGVLYVGFLWFTLPDISDPRSLFAAQSTVITDRHGTELYRLFQEEDRTFVEGDEIPEHMKNAIVAIEDERFYDRGCLDVRALARVVFRFGQAGGASTLTRQLARNALDLKQDNLINRKMKELVLGCQLEARYSKEELLNLYLNWIPFGQNAYGIEQASKKYFGTSASGITLAQSAVLAALPQRPSYFSPYGNHIHTTVSDEVVQRIVSGKITKVSQIDSEDIRIGLLGGYVGTGATTLYVGGRTDQVLRNMEEQGHITDAERLTALEELDGIEFTPLREDIRAPYFVLWVRNQLEELLVGTKDEGVLEQGGFTVETTLDWDMQKAAEQVVTNHREDISNRFGAEHAALVSIDPKTREVLAYVGNVDYSAEEEGTRIDMAQVPRQPGSSFKSFVYAAAFQRGYGPATPLYDVPTKFGDDEPVNFDGLYWGLLTIRKALGASRNVPAAKAFFLAGGEDPILNLVAALGAPTPRAKRLSLKAERGEFDYGWPLALGAAETPLLEMVQAYSSLADGGLYKPVVSIRRITDANGNILYEAEEIDAEEILDPRIAYEVTSILSDESVRPEEYWRSQLTVPGYQTAAKTGTSNKCLEWTPEGACKLRKPDNAWVIGYTPNLVTGVWAGNADSSAMFDRAGGLNTASPIWKDYMIRAQRIAENNETSFPVPEGIAQLQISTLSGQLPTECTPVAFRGADVFLEENIPTEPDPACAQLSIDKVTGLLASDSCPEEAREEGSFLVARSLLPVRWPTWEEGVQKWVTEQMEIWNASETHTGALIPLPVAPTEECDITKTPGRLNKPEVSLIFPQTNSLVTYPSFKPNFTYNVGSSVQEVRFEIDGKVVKTATEEPFDGPIRIPRSISQEGQHSFTITVVDEYYNAVSETVSFRFGVDSSNPSVRFDIPRGDITLPSGGELSMKAVATDDGGLKYVQFYLDSTLLTTKPTEPFELTYTLEDVTPGEYMLRVVATDFAGNEGEDRLTLTVR